MSRVVLDEQGAYLREVLGVHFTDDQLRIAAHRLEPQLIIAGAGSGKTTVMAARIVHAVAVQGVAPSAILGLTFTNKAAGELATRVRRSLKLLADRGLLPLADDGDPDILDDLPTVATYNSYAATIVRDHALRIGREPATTLLTEAQRWQLAVRVVRRARGPFEHLPWTTVTVAERLLALSAEMSDHLVTADQIRDADAAFAAEVAAMPGRVLKATTDALDVAQTRGELLTLVADYESEKRRLDLIDFGDQIALAAEIAERAPGVGAIERDRFVFVVLDEYQDTGVAQRVLLTSLFGGGHPVVAVGDANQAIYGWRGASVGNLLRFAEHFPRSGQPSFDHQQLGVSFRCGQRILTAANAIAASIGAHAGARRPTLLVDPLRPDPERGDLGEVVIARHETDVDEAGWIADRFADRAAAGTKYGDMAVLVRRSSDFVRLQRALVDRGIPVEVVGLGGLLQMPEVADVVAMLALLDDPEANTAVVRILTGPRWAIGVRDLAELGRRAAHLATWSPGDSEDEPAPAGIAAALAAVTARVDPVDVPSLLDAVHSLGDPERYSQAAVERLQRFRTEIDGFRSLAGQPLIELVTEVVRTIGLDVEIEADARRVAAARFANLAAFCDHAARFTGLEGESDLAAFLAYLAAAAAADDGLDLGWVSQADTVKLMTVHKAKGLEWDTVAVPSLVADVFPSKLGRPSAVRNGHVIPIHLRGDRHDLPVLAGVDKAAIDGFVAEVKVDAIDEERRLAYVAFTRAKSLLLASGFCWSGARKSPCRPSMFLDELAALEGDGVTVDVWADDPADAANPLVAESAIDIAWPAEPDAERLRIRRAAAERVRAEIAAATHADAAPTLTFDDEPLPWSVQAQLLVDELRRERSTVRDVPLPRQLSASQVVLLAEDPEALASRLGRPMPQRPAPQARRGSRFHAWVESLWQDSPLIDDRDLPGATDADLTDEQLLAFQQRFLADGWGERRPVAVEKPFELVLAGRLLKGRIDAIYDGADTDPSAGLAFDVIDYKTGSVPRDFAAASVQLSIYRLAWADIAGVDPTSVGAGFLYVATGQLKRPDHLLSRPELAGLLAGSSAGV